MSEARLWELARERARDYHYNGQGSAYPAHVGPFNMCAEADCVLVREAQPVEGVTPNHKPASEAPAPMLRTTLCGQNYWGLKPQVVAPVRLRAQQEPK